jgi:hypothetical protein
MGEVSPMNEELERYFKEARAVIKDNAVLESVVTGMKTVIIEATGDCPCGDPDCNGHCKYGLEENQKPEEPKQEAVEQTPLQILEAARGDTPKKDFVQALREAIEQVNKAPLKARLKQKLDKYASM